MLSNDVGHFNKCREIILVFDVNGSWVKLKLTRTSTFLGKEIMRTKQMKEWTGQFGVDYTDRNALSLPELQELYRKNYGTTRMELNRLFLGGIDRSTRVLEVGSNVGNQLCYCNKWDLLSYMVLSYKVMQ